MKNIDQAIITLLEMFKNRNFPEHVAFTIIKRKACDTAAKPSDNWSIGNILIMAFIGKTDDARTYKQWQAAHRQVKRGAKAFYIYAPVTRKIKAADSLTGEDDYILLGFRTLPVFRLEDTEGEPVNTADYTPPVMPPFLDVAAKLGLTVTWGAFNNMEFGSYNTRTHAITLRSKDAFIYFHELAHAVNATFADLKQDRAKAEIVADLTAAVLCELQGINGYQQQTYRYVQSYCRDRSDNGVIKAVLSVLNDVEKIVNIIIDTANKPCAGKVQG